MMPEVFFPMIFVLQQFNSFAQGMSLPSYLKKCSLSDPKYKECALRNGNDAIPRIAEGDQDLDIPSFNPLILQPTSVTTSTFNFHAGNLTVEGFTNAELVDIGIDLKTKYTFLKLRIPKITITFEYEASGKIVSLPIKGGGPGRIDLYNGLYNFGFNYKMIQRDGQHYIELGEDKFKIEPEKVVFQFNNLFDGDTKSGNHVNEFFNDNWKKVVEELGPLFIYSIGDPVARLTYNLVTKVPLEEIFSNYTKNE